MFLGTWYHTQLHHLLTQPFFYVALSYINLYQLEGLTRYITFKTIEGCTGWKLSKCDVFWVRIYFLYQCEYRKIQARKNSVFGHFSRSDILTIWATLQLILSLERWPIDHKLCQTFFMINSFISHEIIGATYSSFYNVCPCIIVIPTVL